MGDRPDNYRGLYGATLAATIKKSGGGKYRPSNGSEGEAFRGWFCDRCKRDAGYRADPESGNGCNILAASFAAYDVDDPKYPAEWQYGPDGQPTCTAWEAE